MQQNIKTLILKALKITNEISKENKVSEANSQFLFTTPFGFIQGDIDNEYSDSPIRADGLPDLNFALNLSKKRLEEEFKFDKNTDYTMLDDCLCLKDVTIYPKKELENKIKADTYLLFSDMIIGIQLVSRNWVDKI